MFLISVLHVILIGFFSYFYWCIKTVSKNCLIMLFFCFLLWYVYMFLLNWKNKSFQTLCRKLYVILSQLLIKYLLGKLPAVFLFARIILTFFFLPQNQSEYKANITEPNWKKGKMKHFAQEMMSMNFIVREVLIK